MDRAAEEVRKNRFDIWMRDSSIRLITTGSLIPGYGPIEYQVMD